MLCDEGVYCIVADIILKHPEEFKNLFPMMGGFHMAKVAMHCIGKYLKGCGIEDALVETSVFGLKTIESIIDGSNYVLAPRFTDCYRSCKSYEVRVILDNPYTK